MLECDSCPTIYHIADPPYVLTKIGELTGERLIMQTSNVLSRAGNWAKFIIREDRTAEGLTSIRGGRGVWRFTVDCLRAMLTHAGFEILDERRPPADVRRQFPWYSALAPRDTGRLTQQHTISDLLC